MLLIGKRFRLQASSTQFSQVLFLYRQYVTDPLPINLISAKRFLQLFLFSTTYSSSSLLSLPQVLCFNMLLHSNDNENFFFFMKE